MAINTNKVPSHLRAGLYRTIWIPSTNHIQDIHKPTIAELNASGNVELSRYIDGNEGFSLSHSQETVDDSREAYAATGKINGQEKFENGTLHVIDNVNTEDAEESNEAVKALTQGATGYFVRRRGKKYDAEWAAGDVVSVFPATIGLKTAFKDDRQMSEISFAVDPSASDEKSTVTAGA